MLSPNKKPSETRHRILESAYCEMQKLGFQRASLNSISAAAGVTKGALYHHFSNKTELAYAVVDELIKQEIYERWISPLETTPDPISMLCDLILDAQKCITIDSILQSGCPLNNLSQEMSLADEGFRVRLKFIYSIWCDGISEALSKGQIQGIVTQDIKPKNTAVFIISSIEGILGILKTTQDDHALSACVTALVHYLTSLRN